MAKPKIRHIAIIARDPAAVAKYYETVFEMEIIHKSKNGGYFVSDGYLTMAVLPHRLTGTVPVGLNHFGFHVEDHDLIANRIRKVGMEEPKKRPDDRPYAESRACDPEGNMFDISTHGFSEADARSEKAKEPA